MEKAMNAHTISQFNQRLNAAVTSGVSNGLCRDAELFREILATFPDATVTFKILTETQKRVIRSLQIAVPHLGGKGRAYFDHADILAFFLELRFWEHIQDEPIVAQTFTDDGYVLAKILQRELIIVHQFQEPGRGYRHREYEPFSPD